MRQQTNDLGCLSQQEQICAGWLCEYLTNREIAERMGLSARSVETIINRLKKKLNCYSKVQLICQLIDEPWL